MAIHLALLSAWSTRREENAGTFYSRLCRGSLCSCLRYPRAYRSMSFARSTSLFLRRRDRSLRSLLYRFQPLWWRRQIPRIPPNVDLLRNRIEGVQGLLILSRLNGKDLDVASRRNFRPALCCESAVHCALDAVDHERVFCPDLFPRVGLVLAKVCTVVVVGFNVLSE